MRTEVLWGEGQQSGVKKRHITANANKLSRQPVLPATTVSETYRGEERQEETDVVFKRERWGGLGVGVKTRG